MAKIFDSKICHKSARSFLTFQKKLEAHILWMQIQAVLKICFKVINHEVFKPVLSLKKCTKSYMNAQSIIHFKNISLFWCISGLKT